MSPKWEFYYLVTCGTLWPGGWHRAGTEEHAVIKEIIIKRPISHDTHSLFYHFLSIIFSYVRNAQHRSTCDDLGKVNGKCASIIHHRKHLQKITIINITCHKIICRIFEHAVFTCLLSALRWAWHRNLPTDLVKDIVLQEIKGALSFKVISRVVRGHTQKHKLP